MDFLMQAMMEPLVDTVDQNQIVTNCQLLKEELLKLAQDDAKVEEYLICNNLLKKRPGSVLLKGRGVTKSEAVNVFVFVQTRKMEDGKQGLEGLQATKIFTLEHSDDSYVPDDEPAFEDEYVCVTSDEEEPLAAQQ